MLQITEEYKSRGSLPLDQSFWDSTGLIKSSLDPNQKKVLSDLLNIGISFMSKNEMDYDVLIIPSICRIFYKFIDGWDRDHGGSLKFFEFQNLIDVEDLIGDIEILYSETIPGFKKFKWIDSELEFCSIFSNNYYNKITHPLKNLKQDQIKKYLDRVSKINYIQSSPK